MAKKQKPKTPPTRAEKDMSKAWQKSTGMPMVNQPPSGPGETNFAKDEKKK